jgi:hypothetical protein
MIGHCVLATATLDVPEKRACPFKHGGIHLIHGHIV